MRLSCRLRDVRGMLRWHHVRGWDAEHAVRKERSGLHVVWHRADMPEPGVRVPLRGRCMCGCRGRDLRDVRIGLRRLLRACSIERGEDESRWEWPCVGDDPGRMLPDGLFPQRLVLFFERESCACSDVVVVCDFGDGSHRGSMGGSGSHGPVAVSGLQRGWRGELPGREHHVERSEVFLRSGGR